MVIGTVVTAYKGYQLYGDARKYAGAGLQALALVQSPTGAGLRKFGGTAVDIIGLDKLIGSFVKHAVRLALRSRGVDSAAMEDMLNLMRARVPRDTGLLLNGITGEIEDGVATVTASAVKETGSGIDYAFLVEYGTKPGVRGRSRDIVDANFYSLDADLVTGSGVVVRSRQKRKTRLSYRTHPGTPAQPFFFNSAREILADRVERLDAAADAAAADAGFA